MGDALLAAATAAREQAYCPYSGFAVGVALEGDDGRVFTGCNVENASYGAGHLRRAGGAGRAVAAGVRRSRRLVVVAGADPPVRPCGACRQVLAEFGAELVVQGVGPAGTRQWTIRELLPDSFSLTRGA